MRIVILDGFTLNPGDLSWDPLKAFGECIIHDRSRAEDIPGLLKGAEVAFTNKAIVDRQAIEQNPTLRYIGVTATGVNIVDLQAARERGIVVTNVPGYGTTAVAQMVFALLLELAHRTAHHAQTVRDGRWSRSSDFCYWDFPLVELSGRTLGIIGYGRIGAQVAKIGRAFGMNILATQRTPKPIAEEGVRTVDLDTLLRESDVVSLHCPLTPETKGLINAERLRTMKRSAFLINTSRGPLIVEEDLAAALQEEIIAGAGLDVLAVEPPPANHILFKAPNCFVTPHIAWATRDARQRLMNIAVENLKSWVEGKPRNVVN